MMSDLHPRFGTLGLVVGATLSVVMVGLIYGWYSSSNEYGLYGIIIVAVGVLCPLLIANLVLSFIYAKRKVSRSTYLWMWGPPVAVATSLALFIGARQLQDAHFDSTHPAINEVHINLSGRGFWLDPSSVNDSANGRSELRADQPEKFVELTRWPVRPEVERNETPYEGARLSKSFFKLQVFSGEPKSTVPVTLPVSVAAYPDVSSLAEKMSFARGQEASVLTHLYYHYSDRVEVVPAIMLSGSQRMALQGPNIPVVNFHLSNLRAWPIARLEIDGQAVALGSQAFLMETQENAGCRNRNYEASALTRLAAPLRVRWQYALPNPQWNEAIVSVPLLNAAKTPKGHIRSTDVDLYFQDDGSVVAERSQTIEVANNTLAIHTTGVGRKLLRPAPCGFAPDRYDESVTVIRD
jgi:hypothetical protein